jgi:hypothetical protein
MTFDEAKQTILRLLQAQGRAKNGEMLAALGGDAALFGQVREDMIFDDLAEDKNGVGLIYTGPAAEAAGQPLAPTPPATPSSAVPRPSSVSRPRRIFLILWTRRRRRAGLPFAARP